MKTQTCDLRLGDWRNVLGDVHADLIFTSPPYNIGSKSPAFTGRRQKGGFDRKSFRSISDYPDTLPEATYQQQQRKFLAWCADHICEGGVVVYNHKNRRRAKELVSPHLWFPYDKLRLVDELVWDRGSTHNHDKTMLWPQTERLYVFARRQDRKWYFNNYADADNGSLSRSDVWRLPKVDVTETVGHNAPFPLELARRVILKWCPAGGLVCDPYSGSGTAALVAVTNGRNFVGSEVLPKYHALAMERLATATTPA